MHHYKKQTAIIRQITKIQHPMRRIILLNLLCLAGLYAMAQRQTQIIGDSVRIHSNSGTAELNLENSTDSVLGFLYNTGRGRTQFRRGLVKISDTLYLVGADTLIIHKGGSNTAPTLASVLAQGNYAIAGTATNPPIVMLPGTLTTTPQRGAVEYDGVGYYITDSTGARHDLTQTDRIFKIYSQDYDQLSPSFTYTLIGWNATYVNDPTFAHTVVSTMDIEVTLPVGTPGGSVVTVQFQGSTIYSLTVTGTLTKEAYVIGTVHINQDIKYPEMYFLRGATETIDGSGVLTGTNSGFRLYPQSFSNPSLTLSMSAGPMPPSGLWGRIGCTYTVDKKQQGRWLF